MLEEIYIKDFALIRELKIQFGSGMNLITGETGAGKSIILGALNLVLGSKATTDLIRSGARYSVVEARFDILRELKDARFGDFVREFGLDVEESYLILRREINIEGRGKSFINARQVPVSVLRDIGAFLVEIHGQNEHQNILSVSTHREMLDRFARLEPLKSQVDSLFKQRNEVQEKLKSVSLDEKEKERRMEIIRHEIREIDDADLQDNDEPDQLIQEEKTLENAEAVLGDINLVYEELSQSDQNIIHRISRLQRTLEKNLEFLPDLGSALDSIQEAYYHLEDASEKIRDAVDNVHADPERLSIVQERLAMLQKLIRKYGQVEKIKEYYKTIQNEYRGIELSSEEEEKLRAELKKINGLLREKALELSAKRKEHAKRLETAIEAELKDLGMADTRIGFSIKWDLGEDGIIADEKEPEKKYIIYSHGLDNIEIYLAGNENMPLRPLRKIASGGEMSRIMLAIKKVIIDSDPVSSMVFDEVDTGIGGKIGEAVGNKLAGLSKNAQVIVVTHLHQIAGMGGENVTHFKVTKTKEMGTDLKFLNTEARIQEVARMISGETITPEAVSLAETMIRG